MFDNKHARIAPSSLSITVACNASVQLQEMVPPLPETEDQAEGNAGHWVARRYIAGYEHEFVEGTEFNYNGRIWTVDADMHAGAIMYQRAMGAPHPGLFIEHSVQIKRVHDTECAGTPDARQFFNDARTAYTSCPPGLPEQKFINGQIKLIRVGDYKYGRRFVEVFENYQGVAYITGVADTLGLSDADDNLYFEFILVQPRSYHKDGPVRIWRGKLNSLRGLVNIANGSAQAALMPLNGPHAPLARTGKHCLDCDARYLCGTLQLNVNHVAHYAGSAERVDLNPEALGQELMIVDDAIELLKARKTGLDAQAESFIRGGKNVPHYHMEQSATRLTYKDDVNSNELLSLGDIVGVDLRKKLELKDLLVTPTQALQLGIDPEVMKHYAERPKGKFVLTRDNPIIAKKVFST